ncbi:hypothetical protein F5X99DRAFT_424556 [Biscogniauxia marginata]|nr:hypothetical protein F5X99DRAFT_424556 [Biscogniauxia marginata]
MPTNTPLFRPYAADSIVKEDSRSPIQDGVDISQLNGQIAAESRKASQPGHDMERVSQGFNPMMIVQLHDETHPDESTDRVSCAIDALAKTCGIEPIPLNLTTGATVSNDDLGWEFIKVLRCLMSSSNNGLPTDISVVSGCSNIHNYMYTHPRSWKLVHLLHHDRGGVGGILLDRCNIPADENRLLRSELLCALRLLREELNDRDESQKQALVVTVTAELKVRVITASVQEGPTSPEDDVKLHVMVGKTMDFSSANNLENWTGADYNHWKSNLTKLMRQIFTGLGPLPPHKLGPARAQAHSSSLFVTN